MIKKVIVLILVAICIFATGCYEHVSNGDSYSSTIYLYVDPITGVNYLKNKDGGITPRLNADGSLYVSEVK